MLQRIRRADGPHHRDELAYTNGTSRRWPNSVEEGQRINFKDTRVLTRTTGYLDRIVKDATEMQYHPDNFETRDLNCVDPGTQHKHTTAKQGHQATTEGWITDSL